MAKKKTAKTTTKKTTTKKTTKKSGKKKSGKKKPGLYANIHKAQKRAKSGGRKTRKKGAAGAPTNKDFKNAEKTAKK